MPILPRMKKLKGCVVACALIVLTSLFVAPDAQAQPVLNFKRIVNNWPTIELYFQVTCDGQPAYVFNKEQNFKVFENGIEVGEFTLWCPDPRQRCAISVSLVFDASLSMSGAAIAGSKAAGHLFVDLMDGIVDEAAIIFFTTPVWIEVGMTTNKTDLHDAVNTLAAMSCCSAVWDGIYVGIQELVQSGSNPCRAVIALTDGRDNASIRTPDELIALANRNRVRVFTIGLGNVNYSDLQTVAELTGGQFYQAPTPDQLVGIYQEISTIIYNGFNECLITYEAKCQDGGLRTVDLNLLSFCQGTDSKTRSYRAPKDTSTYEPLEIALGEATGRGNSEVQVPLNLVTPIIPRNSFEPASFTVLFDESCAQFVRFETPPGTLLAGIPTTVEPINGGIKITTLERTQIDGNGILGEFTFHASDPNDTTCCDLDLATWVFEAGCYKPVLTPGRICIMPRAPIVDCTISMPSSILWIRSLKDYTPNPFDVRMVVTNSGDKPAENAHFTIDFDPGDFQLRSPITDIQPGTPVNVPVGQISEASWSVQAQRRLTGDSVTVCITASFDNHPDVTCCATMWIPPTEAILECSIDPIGIVADNDNQRYVPMPFDLNVNVVNVGGKKTDSVFATIIVPPDLELAGNDAPDNHTKKVAPGLLLPNQSGSVSWTLWHPIVLTETDYVVQVWVKTSNADSSLCEMRITIPPMDAPSLRVSCQTPVKLVFDENTNEYTPNPFDITITAVNLGKMAADSVSVYLYLPDDCVLDPPAQPLRVSFGTLDPWKTGDPYESHTWRVRWTKKYRYDNILQFKWAAGGIGRTGVPTDTVYSYCETEIPGLKPSFSCEIIAPDSLVLNASETNVEPNPFTLRYRIWNTSKQVATIDRATVYFSNDGVALDPATPNNTQTKTVQTVLQPGEELFVEWVFKATGAIQPRNPQFRVVAFDDEENPIVCEKRIPIAALKTALICDLEMTELVVTYDPLLQRYNSPFWAVTGMFTNAGGYDLRNVSAELVVNDPNGYVQYDPAYTNDNPWTTPVLFMGQTKSAEWGFTLAKPNTTGISQYVEFVINYGSNETPWIQGACTGIIEIRPVYSAALECALRAPDTVRFIGDRYEPGVFDVKLRVTNIGTGDAENVQAYVLQDQGFTSSAGASPLHAIGTLPAGKVYDFTDFSGFSVKVKPREISGYDTITVVVVAEGIPRAICTYPVYVEAELRPRFELVCSTVQNVLIYDENVNDYIPNPVQITTTLTNTGQTAANTCELVFLGPKKFVPFGQNSHHPLGTPGQILNPGESYTYTWNLKALLQNSYSSEEVVLQAHGRGGLNNDLVIAECRVQIDLPPARAAAYSLTCTAPQSLDWDAISRNYVPDPFQMSVRVENSGIAAGKMIDVTLNLAARVFLPQGESATKTIHLLPVGADTVVTWLLRPIAADVDAVATLCAVADDGVGGFGTCCSDVAIPKSTGTDITLECGAEVDTLSVDIQAGDYAPNPFQAYLKIINSSPTPMNDVQAELIRTSNDILVLDDPVKDVAASIPPGQSIGPLTWDVRMKPASTAGCIDLVFRVTASNLAPTECHVTVCYPPLGTPRLDCNLSRLVAAGSDDYVLNFDTEIGDYEGEPNGTGSNTFTITANVFNVGELPARSVTARIAALDGGATLAGGEVPNKALSPSQLDPMANGSVSWKFLPTRKALSSQQRFQVCVQAYNGEQTCCEYEMTIEGAPKTVELAIPDNLVGQFGDKIAVPIRIGRTIGLDLFMYRIGLSYDPDVVRFVGVSSAGTATGQGWSGARANEYTLPGASIPNAVIVQDFTTGSPLNTTVERNLVYLLFEAVYGDDADKMGYVSSELVIADSIDANGTMTFTSMNNPIEQSAGEIYIAKTDGLVTVSGECIVPLTAGASYDLKQNIPNPFNPETVIGYTLPRDAHVTIDVLDVFGRSVRTLVDADKQKGDHKVVFTAEGLPSGVYYYRMKVPDMQKVMKMVIEK